MLLLFFHHFATRAFPVAPWGGGSCSGLTPPGCHFLVLAQIFRFYNSVFLAMSDILFILTGRFDFSYLFVCTLPLHVCTSLCVLLVRTQPLPNMSSSFPRL